MRHPQTLMLGGAVFLLGGYLASCSSAPVEDAEREHDAIAARSGLYCEYVRQTGKTDELELLLNAQVAKHCGHGRVPSLTQYIVGEVRGIMFCCNKEAEPKAAPAPTSTPSPAPRPSVLPRLPLKKLPPAMAPSARARRALPPAQKPTIMQKNEPAAQPAPAQTPAAQAPAQPPSQKRPDQTPDVLPSSASGP